jgi:hypothetical protein
MKLEQTECSETSAYKIQTPGNYPEESIQHSEHSESLKSRIWHLIGGRDKRFSTILQNVQIDSGKHKLPINWVLGDCFSGE